MLCPSEDGAPAAESESECLRPLYDIDGGRIISSLPKKPSWDACCCCCCCCCGRGEMSPADGPEKDLRDMFCEMDTWSCRKLSGDGTGMWKLGGDDEGIPRSGDSGYAGEASAELVRCGKVA